IAHRLGREFREEHHLPAEGYYWALLMGGLIRHQPETDLDPSSMAAEVKSLLRTAEEHGATLLVSTSRRSPPAVVDALAEVLSGHPLVAFFQDFRTDPRRTTGHLLGVATQAFLTPDSVSMISETLWAGRGLTLIPMVRDRQSQPVVPTPKHRRFLENIQAQGQGRWFGPSWEPPRTRVDLEYRHPDFLAIQSRLRELLRDVPR
ncbi:MAG TPA: ELM1/GtrOC1 family putative glycosyltransferase, partial [bacterium]|nr:ELM1/GtrOC1 family putative glycosyltransferase [bacterium]